MVMSLTDKKQRADMALKFHSQGYNCSQSVVLAFSDLMSIDIDALAKVSACFGGGFGASGAQCGVLSGQGMVIGIKRWQSPQSKPAVYVMTKELKNEFEHRYGTSQCRELKRAKMSCDTLIKDGVEALCVKLGID